MREPLTAESGILTYIPGPTTTPQSILLARMSAIKSEEELYNKVTNSIRDILKTKSSVHILNGEGMLGLDSACCSLIEPNDHVLIVANGVFGSWFEDLVNKYTANYTVFECSTTSGVSPQKLDELISNKRKAGITFKVATLVHCDTPSGVLNDIAKLVPILSRNSIISIVDIVASSFAVPISLDEWGVDVALMGSQKALSCPSGLTMIAISGRAWEKMKKRTTPIPSYYCNLTLFQSAPRQFPYTMPFHDIAGLDEALCLLKAEGLDNVYRRHVHIASSVRSALSASGLKLYLTDDYSPTVTAFHTPPETTADAILDAMLKDHKIRFSSSLGSLDKKVMRIGHMGFNADISTTLYVLKSLTCTLRTLGVSLKCDLGEHFFNAYYTEQKIHT